MIMLLHSIIWLRTNSTALLSINKDQHLFQFALTEYWNFDVVH